MKTSSFCSPQPQGRKNDRRISFITNDLTSAYTWATPKTASSAGGRHDA
jgi:hypothetical protein